MKPDLALDRFTIKNIEKRLQVNYFDQRSQLYQVPLKHEAMDMAKSTIMTVKGQVFGKTGLRSVGVPPKPRWPHFIGRKLWWVS